LKKERKICPRCGLPGRGPYGRWTNKPQFGPYYYFAHKSHGKIKWCYIPREWLSNSDDSDLTGEKNKGERGPSKSAFSKSGVQIYPCVTNQIFEEFPERLIRMPSIRSDELFHSFNHRLCELNFDLDHFNGFHSCFHLLSPVSRVRV